MSLSENRACVTIMNFERVRRAICMPRYTPTGWWQCDVFELTKTGYFREYEVKLSLADFKIDADKSRTILGSHRSVPHPNPTYPGQTTWRGTEENKHELLLAGDVRGPVQFWYVTPVGLINPAILPKFAGLLELHDRGDGFQMSQRWSIREIVTAPKLHKEKAATGVRAEVFSSCYYRFHDLLRASVNCMEPRAEWRDEPAPTIDQEISL